MTDGEPTQQAPQTHHDNGQTGTGPRPTRRRPKSATPRRISSTSPDLGECDLTGPHNIHLLVSDSGITEGNPAGRIYLTLCGTKLSVSDLPSSLCPGECEREITYCWDCQEVINKRNAAAGQLGVGERIQLLLLERVHEGMITRTPRPYFEDDGQITWHMATAALDVLLDGEFLLLSEPGPDGSRRVSLSEDGLARRKELRERQRRVELQR